MLYLDQKGGDLLASLIYQVVDTFKRNTVDMIDKNRIKNEKIPTERYHAQQSNNPEKWKHLIFSYGTYDSYRDRSIVFIKYCKEKFGIKKLNELTPEMVNDYFETQKEKHSNGNISPYTMKTTHSALVKLEACMKKRNWLSNESSLVPTMEELDLPKRDLENRVKGGYYNNAEVEAIYEQVSDTAKQYIDFVKGTGARMKGASTVKVKDINFAEGKVTLPDDAEPLFGEVTLTEKNGLTRTIPVSKEFISWLKEQVKGKGPEDKVLPDVTDRTIQKSIKQACDLLNIKSRGLHGVRGTVAHNMYNKLRNEGLSPKKAKERVSNHLGHKRTTVVGKYLTR